MSRFWILAAAMLAACGGGTSVQGEVDGLGIDLDDAYFVQESGYFDNGDDLVHIVTGGAGGDLCEMMTDYQELLEDADEDDDFDDLGAWWEENLPEDFWQVEVQLRLDDLDEPDEELDGAEWDKGLREDGEANGSLVHFVQPLDEDFWEGDVRGDDIDDYYETFYTDGGSLEVTGFDEGEHISGRFHADVVDNEGDDEGEIEIRFSATRCIAIEKYYF